MEGRHWRQEFWIVDVVGTFASGIQQQASARI